MSPQATGWYSSPRGGGTANSAACREVESPHEAGGSLLHGQGWRQARLHGLRRRASHGARPALVHPLTCHIELFTQAHYRQSIDPDGELSELYKDVFLFHWKEESQHAILDELEWQREDARLAEPQREQAVTDLIELVAAVDGILQMQSAADVDYFLRVCGRAFGGREVQQIRDTMLKAYRWQYIVSGVQNERFQKILGGMITGAQMQRIGAALQPIVS